VDGGPQQNERLESRSSPRGEGLGDTHALQINPGGLRMMEPKELLAYDGPDRIVHFTDYLKIKDADRKNATRLTAPFQQFDKHIDGLCTGELTVISGKTGEGKTLFSESYMKGLLDSNHELKASVFSFEVTTQSLLEKYANNPQLKIYLPLELQSSNINWLRDRVWEAAVKENCRLYLFDHLHFLIDMAERQNMSLNIGRFMREMKLMALELNVAFLLIAHQKGVPKGEDPSLEDVRDSTFIAQEADNVIMVWRRPNYADSELLKMQLENNLMYQRIKDRTRGIPETPDNFSDGFAMVQIAKARRSGTFRWKKLFQKVGPWMEEV
jgi:replicative DNA helicase